MINTEIRDAKNKNQMEQVKKKGAFKLMLSINKMDLLVWAQIVFLLVPHFNPDYLNVLGVLGTLFDFYRFFSFSIIFAVFLINGIVPSKITMLIIIQRLYLIGITIINKGQSRNLIIETGSIIAVLLIFDFFQSSSNFRVFLSATLFCFEIMIYINLLTLFLFPNGMYYTNDFRDTFFVSKRCWFLGYYNNYVKYFIPAYMFAMLYMQETGKKLRSYILIFAMFVTAFIIHSGGVTVSLASITLVMVVAKNWTAIFNYYIYWVSQIVFTFVAIYIGIRSRLYSWILESLLNKTNSFVGRVGLWSKYAKLILLKPITGYGVPELSERQRISGMRWGTHAHNLLLETLYRGGVINLLLLIIIIIIAGRNIYRYRNNMICKIIATCFMGWCIDSFVEPFMTPLLMGMFVVAYYIGNAQSDVEYIIT